MAGTRPGGAAQARGGSKSAQQSLLTVVVARLFACLLFQGCQVSDCLSDDLNHFPRPALCIHVYAPTNKSSSSLTTPAHHLSNPPPLPSPSRPVHSIHCHQSAMSLSSSNERALGLLPLGGRLCALARRQACHRKSALDRFKALLCGLVIFFSRVFFPRG